MVERVVVTVMAQYPSSADSNVKLHKRRLYDYSLTSEGSTRLHCPLFWSLSMYQIAMYPCHPLYSAPFL